MKINPNWKSRKWFIALSALGYGLFLHIFPSVAEKVPQDQFDQVAKIVLGWLIAEGTADVVSRVKKKKDET
jgi:hypothetical protein